LVFHSENRAFIINNFSSKENEQDHFKVVASATIDENDNLYHIDDMEKFKILSNFPPIVESDDDDDSDSHHEAHVNFSDEPYTAQEIKNGSARTFLKSSRQFLTLLQWLHVRLGHCNEQLLKHIVKENVVLGSGVSWKDINKLSLPLCEACMRGKMKAFPIPASISRKLYEVFEYLTCDYVSFKVKSIRHYKGIYIYADKASNRTFGYLVKKKSEWLNTFKMIQLEYGPKSNINSVPTRYFLTDYATEVHDKDFSTYLLENRIKLLNSAPYKHAQNFIERFIQTLKYMTQTAMAYNEAPLNTVCYAIMYSIDTFNMLCSIGQLKTREEIFSGEKTDISSCVPFWATGYAHISPEERLYLDSKSKKNRNDKSVKVKMIGYPDPYKIPNKSNTIVYVKNSYVVLNGL
jgi:hypothetical protein